METKNQYRSPVKLGPKVTVTYDDSPAHVGRLKSAVDFIVPVGTEVHAALEGIVVDVKDDSSIGGDNPSYDKDGNYIEIKHDGDEFSIYEHIKRGGSLVKVGDKVKTWQLIGFSGDTGWLGGLGPHLHFDIHRYTGKGPEDYTTLKIQWKKSLRK